MMHKSMNDIVTTLLHKTKQQEVQWEQGAITEKATGWVVFSLRFPRSSVEIGFRSPRAGPDLAQLWILNDSDQVVAMAGAESGNPDFELLTNLYHTVRNQVLRISDTLSDIRDNLGLDLG